MIPRQSFGIFITTDAGWQRPAALYVGFVLSAFALYASALAVVLRQRRIRWWLLAGFPLLFAIGPTVELHF